MEGPSRQDVERQLRLVLASAEFEASPKLSELLFYLVTETLGGNAERLKGYTIGVDVFGRRPDFDQGVDAIVRVQMGRLRKLLESYYFSSGKNDPIRLILVPGRYTPRFELASGEELREEALDPAPKAEEPKATPTPQAEPSFFEKRAGRALILALGLALVLAVVIAGLLLMRVPGSQDAGKNGSDSKGTLVYVSRYEVLGGKDREKQLADGLQFDIVNQLSKFPDMEVLANDNAVDKISGKGGSRADRANFLLTGVIESDGGKLRVTSQLRRERDGLVIWSDQWTPENGANSSVMELQSSIASHVAIRLGQPYGVIPQALFEDISNGQQPGDTPHACILRTYAYLRHSTIAAHASVRECLEKTVGQSPRHSLAWALLAWVYGDEERYGFNKRPENDAIARALRAAERGVAADSQNAVAYEHLAHARFLTGTDDMSAREALETSLKLNPNNSEVLADAGWILGLMGDTARADQLGRKAIELNPGHPAWYWTGPSIHALMTGNRAAALDLARQNISDRGPIEAYLYAAALRMNGDGKGADAELQALARTYPNMGSRAHMMAVLRIPPKLEMLIFGKPR